MKKGIFNIVLATAMLVASANVNAQVRPTLEWTKDGSSRTAVGYTTNSITVNFLKDLQNPIVPTNAPTYTYDASPLIATVSIVNQQRSTTLTGTTTVVPGITFGGRNTSSQANDVDFPSAVGVQRLGSTNLYDVFAADIPASKPLNNMYITSPSAPAVGQTSNTSGGSLTTGGFDTQNISGAQGPAAINVGGTYLGDEDANFGIAMYTAAEPLADINANPAGRFYYGDVVITFNRTVKDPVVHIGGLGGSYQYTNLSASLQSTYFTTELELVNGATPSSSSILAGNLNLGLIGNNIINLSNQPNAGSTLGDATYGAASGSIKVAGNYTSLTYKIFLKGTPGNFGWSQTAANITSATRDPFNGDLWYLSVSTDKPTQQLSGNVFVDADGLTNNNINTTGTTQNPGTNIGNQLYANLIDNVTGKVVATVPVSNTGTYLFDNINPSTYYVQVTTIPGTPTQNPPATQLPNGWVNTGEFNGKTAGNDGIINGKSAVVTVPLGGIVTDVNFGVEQTPTAFNLEKSIDLPVVGTILTLNNAPSFHGALLPILSGTDPEDKPTAGVLTNNTVQINTLPTNTTLLYNGVTVTAGQVIPNFNPSLLQILFNQYIPDSPTGNSTVFTYSYIDAAGVSSPPATYTVRWPQGAVPVTLESFEVLKVNCTANLIWKTSAEINVNKYVLQLSTDNGNRFEDFGTVSVTGNSNTVKTYTQAYEMKSGIVYLFRLKIVDNDGTFKYSNIGKQGCTNTKGTISILPNPVAEIFQVRGMENGKNIISVYAADGKLIKSQISLNNFDDVNISRLASGTYIVRVVNDNGSSFSEKIIKN